MLIVGLLAGGLAAATWLTAALLIISVASAITVVQRIQFIRAGLQQPSRQQQRKGRFRRASSGRLMLAVGVASGK